MDTEGRKGKTEGNSRVEQGTPTIYRRGYSRPTTGISRGDKRYAWREENAPRDKPRDAPTIDCGFTEGDTTDSPRVVKAAPPVTEMVPYRGLTGDGVPRMEPPKPNLLRETEESPKGTLKGDREGGNSPRVREHSPGAHREARGRPSAYRGDTGRATERITGPDKRLAPSRSGSPS